MTEAIMAIAAVCTVHFSNGLTGYNAKEVQDVQKACAAKILVCMRKKSGMWGNMVADCIIEEQK
jgi:hypothetical protein